MTRARRSVPRRGGRARFGRRADRRTPRSNTGGFRSSGSRALAQPQARGRPSRTPPDIDPVLSPRGSVPHTRTRRASGLPVPPRDGAPRSLPPLAPTDRTQPGRAEPTRGPRYRGLSTRGPWRATARRAPHSHVMPGLVTPVDVAVPGPHGFRVMVGEQRCVFVPRGAAALEPRREVGVQERPGARRQRPVGDLAGEGVLEDVLALGLERRARVTSHEVPLLERPEVWFRPAE